MLKKILDKVAQKVKSSEPKESEYERLIREGKIPKPKQDFRPSLDYFALSPDARRDLQGRRAKKTGVRALIRGVLGIEDEPRPKSWYRSTEEERWRLLDEEIEARKKGKFYFPEDVRGPDQSDRAPWEEDPYGYELKRKR